MYSYLRKLRWHSGNGLTLMSLRPVFKPPILLIFCFFYQKINEWHFCKYLVVFLIKSLGFSRFCNFPSSPPLILFF